MLGRLLSAYSACLSLASLAVVTAVAALDRLAEFILATVPRPPGLMLNTVAANVPRASTPISSSLFHANRHEARSARLGAHRHV
jgi:hypothetical protein